MGGLIIFTGTVHKHGVNVHSNTKAIFKGKREFRGLYRLSPSLKNIIAFFAGVKIFLN